MSSEHPGSGTGLDLFDDPADAGGTGSPPRRRLPGVAGSAAAEDTAVFAPPDLVPRVLRRWRQVIALGVVAAVVGAVIAVAAPSRYTASALVQLGAGAADLVSGNAAPLDDLDRRIATETEIIVSDRVRAAAESGVGRELPPVTVTQETSSSLLAVTVTADDPDEAAQDADAYVEAYLGLTSSRTRDQLDPAVGVLQERLRNIEGSLKDLQVLLEEVPADEANTAATDALQARVQNLLEERSDVKTNIDRLEGAAAIGNLEVRSFADAVAPEGPSSMPPLRLALVALVVGLVAGAVLAAAVPLDARRRPRR